MASQERPDVSVAPSNGNAEAVSHSCGARYHGPSYISGGTTIMGDNHGIINLNHNTSHAERIRLLNSLRYPEINARFNEIKESHYATFQWIFRDDPTSPSKSAEHKNGLQRPLDAQDAELSVLPTNHLALEPNNALDTGPDMELLPWYGNDTRDDAASRLISWLRKSRDESQGQTAFLVQGKAGSGKSTFMKFVFQHERTTELFQQAASSEKVMRLFHSFWLVGTNLQNSYKGFVSSLIHQLVTKCPSLLDVCQTIPGHEHKHSLSDWSESDLCSLLLAQLKQRTHAICLFIDGLDEFDNHDDPDRLITLLEQIRTSSADCKFCLSCRPGHYLMKSFVGMPSLRLQDLTYKDIESYVQITLREKTASLHDDNGDKEKVRRIGTSISSKADGVFLWAYYVLQNVCGGLRGGDDLDALHKRIEVLPSAIVDLYRHMWTRQDNDNVIHGEEAAKMFTFGKFFPMPLFELMVAMDTQLQEHYLTQAKRIGEKCLNRVSVAFKERVASRSAGLLECYHSDNAAHWSDPFDSYPEESTGKHRYTVVGYFHRTVHDFLTGTTEGHQLVGRAQGWTTDAVGEAMMTSYLASVIEGRECLSLVDLHIKSGRITDYAARLRVVRQCWSTCEQLWRRSKHSRVSDNHGWVHCLQQIDAPPDRDDCVLYRICELDDAGFKLALSFIPKVWQQFCIVEDGGWSAYYKGHLGLCQIIDYDIRIGEANSNTQVVEPDLESNFFAYGKMISWMQDVRADMVTPHSILSFDEPMTVIQRGPILQILSDCLELLFHYDPEEETVRSLLQLLPPLSMLRALLQTQELTLRLEFYGPSSDQDGDRWDKTWVYMTFKAKSVIEVMMSYLCDTSRKHREAGGCDGSDVPYPCQFRANSRSGFQNPTIDAELGFGFRSRVMALPAEINVSRQYRNEPVESLRPHLKFSRTIKELLTCNKWPGSRWCRWYMLGDEGQALPLMRVLAQTTCESWHDLPLDMLPDMHFVRGNQYPSQIPLDPFVEASSQDWRKACSMRRYFAKLGPKEIAKREQKSPDQHESTQQVEPIEQRTHQESPTGQPANSHITPPTTQYIHTLGSKSTFSKTKSPNKFLQRLQKIGKRTG